MNNKRIDINLNLSGSLADMLMHRGGKHQQQPSETDREAFEQALHAPEEQAAQDHKHSRQPAESESDNFEQQSRQQDEKPDNEMVSSPFDLLSNRIPNIDSIPTNDSMRLVSLEDNLLNAAGRLLVGEGAHGKEVIVDLKDDVLPGVQVSVFENEGRLVARFVCTDSESRIKLTDYSQTLATELSSSLKRNVLVQILNDKPDDTDMLEIMA